MFQLISTLLPKTIFKKQCLKSVDLNKKYLYYCIILDCKTVLLLLLLLLQCMGPCKQAGVGTWCKQACMGPVHACMHGSIGHGHRHAGIWQSRSIWALASPPVTCCITTIATALPAAAAHLVPPGTSIPDRLAERPLPSHEVGTQSQPALLARN